MLTSSSPECDDSNSGSEDSNSTSEESSGSSTENNGVISQSASPEPIKRRKRVALVFGREELGMSDEEVDSCDVVCSIPIGRLQESLSLSHAVTLALSTIFQQRLSYVAGGKSHGLTDEHAAGQQASSESLDGSKFVVQDLGGLADGCDTSPGVDGGNRNQ
eukprot:gene15019-21091_t